MSRAAKSPDNVLLKSIPVQRTDVSTFDDSFSFLREKFAAEMRRVDDEMNKFSANLRTLYGQSSQGPAPGSQQSPVIWDSLASSPLIQGDGNDRMLKLQFDLSQFEPSEIKVQILHDILTVSASHLEKTDNRTIVKEFNRDFVLPRGIDPNLVISSLSRDGVLTVQAPLPTQGKEAKGKDAKEASKPADLMPKSQKPPDVMKMLDPASQVPQSPLSPVSPAATKTPSSQQSNSNPRYPSSAPQDSTVNTALLKAPSSAKQQTPSAPGSQPQDIPVKSSSAQPQRPLKTPSSERSQENRESSTSPQSPQSPTSPQLEKEPSKTRPKTPSKH